MKKVFVIIPIVFSFLVAGEYSDGYKLYKKAKYQLKHGHKAKASSLFTQARDKFIIAAAKNSSSALIKLAELYCNGWGMNKNKIKAKEYLEKAQKLTGAQPSDKCLQKLQ